MGSIRKYKDKYRAEIHVDGVRKSKVFRLKSDAKEWVSDTETNLRREGNIDKTLVSDILIQYRDTVSVHKKGWHYENLRINAFLKEEWAKLQSDQITARDISYFRDARLKEVQTSTVNRELNLLSAIFSKAVQEWRYLYNNPVKGVKRPKNPAHRDRLISDDEIKTILFHLGNADEITLKRQLVGAMFTVALETAMRLGEICGLKASDVVGDVATLVDTKNGDKREVALSKKAQEQFERIFASGLTTKSKQASAIFKKYNPIKDITFHDSRHTAITRLAKKLDVLDLCRMTGHRDINNVMIYYNETASDIAKKL